MPTNRAYTETTTITAVRAPCTSASEEEPPAADEQMPAQPQPQAEQEGPAQDRTHERAEQVRERRPVGAPHQPDPLPSEQERNDDEPTDEGDRSDLHPRPAYPP